MTNWSIEDTPLGRILVAPRVPLGTALFYTTIDFPGVLDHREADRIEALLRSRFEIDASLRTCRQVHGVTLVASDRRDGWCEPDECDALWADARQVALGIKVADCLPVTIIDPECAVVANIHSGWRGAAAGIVSLTLDELQRASSFSSADSLAYLGPSIRSCCFEVGEEVVGEFRKGPDPDDRWVDRSRGERPHLDLAGLTRAVLEQRGFAPGAVLDSGICTRCEGSIFHSYRRDRARSGRNLAVVAQ